MRLKQTSPFNATPPSVTVPNRIKIVDQSKPWPKLDQLGSEIRQADSFDIADSKGTCQHVCFVPKDGVIGRRVCGQLTTRIYAPTSEHERNGNDKQDADGNRQNLDGVIMWSVIV
jgi:hypothetical protein